MVSHGEVLHIAEILARGDACNGASVRVLGTLEDHDVAAARLRISHAGSTLAVDSSALGGIAVRPGELLQFIGEISVEPPALLRARIIIRVDGLNVQLFDKALQAQRAFLRETARAVPAPPPGTSAERAACGDASS